MNAIEEEPRFQRSSEDGSLAGALEPGVLVLGTGGTVVSADERTTGLLGCADRGDLDRVWDEIRPRLEAQGVSFAGGTGGSSRAVLELPSGPEGSRSEENTRRLSFQLRADAGILLIQDADAAEALESDLRLSALMRSLTQITPAVAHDLRAPINAMVFNVEILKETIASGKGNEPGGKERQLRYVNVLKEELHRLHREMEIFIAHISPRGDRTEILDLRELIEELAVLLTGPARKQQVQLRLDLPESPVTAEVNRYALRQALLHVSLAALSGVPREGSLEVGLERREKGIRMRIAGTPAGPEPAAGFDVRFTPAGVLAQLHVARAILAAQGGEVRPVTGEPQTFEVELTVARNKE